MILPHPARLGIAKHFRCFALSLSDFNASAGGVQASPVSRFGKSNRRGTMIVEHRRTKRRAPNCASRFPDAQFLAKCVSRSAGSVMWSRISSTSVRVSVSAVLLFAFAVPGWGEDPDPTVQTKTPGDRATLSRIPQNLGGNFLALFDTENLLPLVVGGAATGGIAFFDHDIRNGWGIRSGSSTMGSIGGVAGGAAVMAPAIAGLFVLGRCAGDDRFRSFSYALAQSAILDEGFVEGLKYAVGRTRPNGSDNHSFPSGHASMAFMFATVGTEYYGWKAGLLGYSAATFIALSRSRENVHWASDLAGGATIGYLIGSTVSRRTGVAAHARRIVMTPIVDLRTRTIGIQIRRRAAD